LVLAVTSAKRDGGGFVTVEGTVTNNTDTLWVAADWRGDEKELARNGGSIAGASLIDQKGKKKYLILRDTSGRCLCTQFTGGVRQGETTQWFAQFPAPPADTTAVDFQVGSMPPASIEISEG
jgi:C4-type Zn-finger protein